MFGGQCFSNKIVPDGWKIVKKNGKKIVCNKKQKCYCYKKSGKGGYEQRNLDFEDDYFEVVVDGPDDYLEDIEDQETGEEDFPELDKDENDDL